MGIDAEFQVPVIEFRTGSPDLERGTEGWHQNCKRVREACEMYGCFQVVYEKISRRVREETFALLKDLVEEVPLERKQMNANPKPYHSYFGPCSQDSLYEGFGIEDASNYDSVKSFAHIMWPDGHPYFCETVNTIVKQMEELNNIIWLMIIDSYGLGEKWETVMMNSKTLLRMMKYMSPSSGEYRRGLHAHTDKPVSTIICEDQIPGLEIEGKDGQWIKLSSSSTSFVFLVGDPLMVWSNGRMKAVKHRVMMNGDKDRYSIAAFTIPVEGTIIKIPEELIDEQHPRLFKDFDFMDFLLFSFSEQVKLIDSADQIYTFASLSPLFSDQNHAHIDN
ncbi:calcium uptake protein 1 [Hibiscus syriacus]|uniref:2-oxoglutarate-dependent dioxygenase DAO n=1 Tax=Hibiscus syriacus TaxID=106335 RepID=A0A6A2YKI0_HIBSY|nr:probable 2-oxoglutarate-dependent dioxygenase AOP1 [Hibiscus syriacus]KAE8678797.1 calcium uptake protein 1 [Hibiscus syriacus]